MQFTCKSNNALGVLLVLILLDGLSSGCEYTDEESSGSSTFPKTIEIKLEVLIGVPRSVGDIDRWWSSNSDDPSKSATKSIEGNDKTGRVFKGDTIFGVTLRANIFLFAALSPVRLLLLVTNIWFK